MVHPTPTQVLLTTPFEPLVRQLSGSLARGVRRIDPLLQDEPTPQKMMTFEHALSALLRAVGRRIMAWVLHHLETANAHEDPLECSLRTVSIVAAANIRARWPRSLAP
jgi:hypothetical protein